MNADTVLWHVSRSVTVERAHFRLQNPYREATSRYRERSISGLREIALPLGERLRMLLLTALLFALEFAVVFADERLDLRSAGNNAEPLFLVEGDGETSHSVKGYSAFLADLETQSC